MATINLAIKEITIRLVYCGSPFCPGVNENVKFIIENILADSKLGKASRQYGDYDVEKLRALQEYFIAYSNLSSYSDIYNYNDARSFEFSYAKTSNIEIKAPSKTNIFSIKINLILAHAKLSPLFENLYMRGTDGVCFVVDSQKDNLENNIKGWEHLESALHSNGLMKIPIFIQYDNRSSPDALSVESLNSAINKNNYPWIKTDSKNGKGIIETFNHLLTTALKRLADVFDKGYRKDTAEKIAQGLGLLTSVTGKDLADKDPALRKLFIDSIEDAGKQLGLDRLPELTAKKASPLIAPSESSIQIFSRGPAKAEIPNAISSAAIKDSRLSPYPDIHPFDDPKAFLERVREEKSPSTIRIYSEAGVIDIWDIVLLNEKVSDESKMKNIFANKSSAYDFGFSIEKDYIPSYYNFLYECVKWTTEVEQSDRILRGDFAKILRNAKIDTAAGKDPGFPGDYRRFFNTSIGKLSNPKALAEKLRQNNKYGQRVFKKFGRRVGCIYAVLPDRMWIHN